MPRARTLSDYERGWVSGIIDGEGSINVVWHLRTRGRLRKNGTRAPINLLNYPRPSMRLTVTNTNHSLLEEFQEITGVGTIHNKKSKRALLKRQGYTYQTSQHSQIKGILSQIRLIAKEDIRKLSLELIELKALYSGNGHGTDPCIKEKAKSVADKICDLNRRSIIQRGGQEL